MHDGEPGDLEQVVDLYVQGGTPTLALPQEPAARLDRRRARGSRRFAGAHREVAPEVSRPPPLLTKLAVGRKESIMSIVGVWRRYTCRSRSSLIVAILVVGFGVLGVWNIRTQAAAVLEQHKEAARSLADAIVPSIESSMLAGGPISSAC